MRKLIIGIDTVFSNNTSWRFVPASHSFDNPLNPFQTAFPETLSVQVLTDPLANLDFTAIKIGDVNNTAVPNLMVSADERTAGEWPVLVEWLEGDRWIGDWSNGSKPQSGADRSAGNDLVEAVFSIPGTALVAAQFTIQFNPEQLVFEKVESLAPGISMENFGLNRTKLGLVTFSYSSDEVALFKIIFRKKDIGEISEHLRLANWPTASLVYHSDGTAFKPVLDWGSEVSRLVVAPNPFGMGGTWISATTAEILEVFDANGMLLFSKNIAPKEAVKLESGLFPGAGVYFWRMGGKSGKFVFAP